MSKEMTKEEVIEWLDRVSSAAANNWPTEDFGILNHIMDLAITAIEQHPQQGCDISECLWFTCEDCTLYTEICGNMEKNKLCGVFERGQCLECYKGQGWIPAEQALPEKKGRYLVALERVTLPVDRWFNGEYFEVGSFTRKPEVGVLAWMSLPEPYREKGES